MRRSTVLTLIAAWLLGIATAMVWPDLLTERMLYTVAIPPDEIALLSQYGNQGWIVSNAAPGRYYVLERPRFRIR